MHSTSHLRISCHSEEGKRGTLPLTSNCSQGHFHINVFQAFVAKTPKLTVEGVSRKIHSEESC